MITSRTKLSLSKPVRGQKIDHAVLAFVQARNRNKAHSLLLERFKESGLSKTELAVMLGKRPEQITRWLGGPGNLTLDTISDLLFALEGAMLKLSVDDAISKAPRNHRRPEWLDSPADPKEVHNSLTQNVTLSVGGKSAITSSSGGKRIRIAGDSAEAAACQ